MDLQINLKCLMPALTILIVSISLLILSLDCSEKSPDTPPPPTTQTTPADMVLRGGKIATVDDSFSFAQALAVAGDKFVFVGADQDVEPFIGPNTQVIELSGNLVVPGLIDAHGHLMMYGTSLASLDCRGTTTYQQIVEMVSAKARQLKPDQWILGNNWDQNDWDVKDLPNHQALTQAAPENPVWLVRIDGHAALANIKALEIAGVTAATQSPAGGEILLDSDGQPTGVFIDNAMDLVKSHVPQPTPGEAQKHLENAAQGCLAVGLTGMHDAGISLQDLANYKALIDAGRLGIRINAMLSDPGPDTNLAQFMPQNRIESYGSHFLTVKCMKLLIDGALGSRGAYLFEPYSDRSDTSGLLTVPYERCLEMSKYALQNDFQMSIHAIGDRANHLVLNAYEEALKEHPKDNHRFRVEHAQIMTEADIARYKPLGVLPSMQPTHATSDMYWIEDRIGPERIKFSYAWRSFLDSGVIIPCGSDFPVEKNNPMLGFYAAITRQDPTGYPAGGWLPQQKMTRQEALKGFTIWAATAAFQEDLLGSIEVGKLADLVVLSKDVLTVEPKEILTTEPLYTIVAGKIAYQKQ